MASYAVPEEILIAIEKLVPDPESEGAEYDFDAAQQFDRHVFIKKMFHDDDLAREVAALFLSYTPELMTQIRDAIRHDDGNGLADTAQALKGSIANIGARGALAIVTELEREGQGGNLVEAKKILGQLEKEMENLRQVLASVSGEAQPWKILIADDDPVSRRMVQATLMKCGHDPIVTSDGKTALALLLGQDAPRVAILDWMMPGLQGIEICRELREKTKNRYVYVILLTGKDKTDDIITALDAGADDYIVKPFVPEELKARVREGFRVLDRVGGSVSVEPDKQSVLHDLLGREAILVALKKEIVQPHDNSSAVSAIMVQLDSFDRIEGDFGQHVANLAVRHLAEATRQMLKQDAAAGLYARDKVLVVLPACDRQQAEALAKDLLSRLETAVIQANDIAIPVTACLGMTSILPSGREHVEHVIAATESAVKHAQTRGPNHLAFVQLESATREPGPERRTAVPSASRLDLELVIASRSGDLKRVKQLLGSGAHVNAGDNKGNTALAEAAFFKYPEVVQLLLDQGADVALHNSGGDTALTEAIRAGHTEVIELLLPKFSAAELKADLALLYRALLEASAFGKTDSVKFVKRYLFAHGYIKASKQTAADR
ncbi:MAG TPA: response regulator [Desulfomonilaceae bacterium]|nr:response regulator [Desulfomonilaceae bacterium]